MILKIITGVLGAFSWQSSSPPLVKLLEPVFQPMIVAVERDPITDAVSAFAVARSSGGILEIGCDPDRFRGIHVTVRSQAWFAGPNFISRHQTMPFRFDRQAPVSGRWKVEDDAAILYPSNQVISFVNSAASAEHLTVRTRDIENREKDLTFSMQGGGPAIREMLQICSVQAK